MKINVGRIDRMIRIVVGLVLITIAATAMDWPYAWAGWIGVIPLLTGFFGICPAYSVFGFNTRADQK